MQQTNRTPKGVPSIQLPYVNVLLDLMVTCLSSCKSRVRKTGLTSPARFEGSEEDVNKMHTLNILENSK